MCGRYTLTTPEDLAGRFGLGALAETRIVPRFNVAPSQGVPVVIARPDQRLLVPMQWGFKPLWMKDDPKRPPPINARAETLLERPMFKGSVANRRCIIPADGFYEWMAVPGRKTKQPMYIRLKDGGLFGFAGLYTGHPDADDTTCAIVTTAANEAIEAIHSRMPVILDRAVEDAWLDPSITNPLEAMAALQPVPADRIVAFPVATLVSSPRNDGPELIEPLSDEVEAVPAQAGLL
jgi:putative SOS response-associated peptidase YedK